mgnify:CR=1 FL=1
MTLAELQLPAPVRQALGELKAGLQHLYGERLRGLYLYGSYTRGDASDDSDVDVLVVLEGEVNGYRESNRYSKLVADICLKYDLLISTCAISAETMETWDSPFLMNVRREGVLL